MRKSFVMLSVALLAAFGLWFASGNATGVSDQQAAELVGGFCGVYQAHDCLLDDGCPLGVTCNINTGTAQAALVNPRACGSLPPPDCQTIYDTNGPCI